MCCWRDTFNKVSVGMQFLTFVYLLAASLVFVAGAASQAGDADAFRGSVLTSGSRLTLIQYSFICICVTVTGCHFLCT